MNAQDVKRGIADEQQGMPYPAVPIKKSLRMYWLVSVNFRHDQKWNRNSARKWTAFSPLKKSMRLFSVQEAL